MFLINLRICLENVTFSNFSNHKKKKKFFFFFYSDTLVMDLCQNVQKVNFEENSKLQEHTTLFSANGHVYFFLLSNCDSQNIMVPHCALYIYCLDCHKINFNT